MAISTILKLFNYDDTIWYDDKTLENSMVGISLLRLKVSKNKQTIDKEWLISFGLNLLLIIHTTADSATTSTLSLIGINLHQDSNHECMSPADKKKFVSPFFINCVTKI